MARNTGNGSRKGSVTDRSQFKGPNGDWIKRDTTNGQFMGSKNDGTPYKGVPKEKDDRR